MSHLDHSSIPDGAEHHPPSTQGAVRIRFGLRALLAFVTLASLVLAAAKFMEAAWSVSLAILGVIVGAHVIGNALGTRLRQHGDRHLARSGPDYEIMRRQFDHRVSQQVTDHAMLKYQPPSRLRSRESLGNLPLVMAALGGIGGAIGAALAIETWFPEFSWGDEAVAVVSFAVLGGLCLFGLATFVQVAIWPAARFYFHRGALQWLEQSGRFDPEQISGERREPGSNPHQRARDRSGQDL